MPKHKYCTARKRLINTDVNGYVNIMKKAAPYVFDYGKREYCSSPSQYHTCDRENISYVTIFL